MCDLKTGVCGVGGITVGVGTAFSAGVALDFGVGGWNLSKGSLEDDATESGLGDSASLATGRGQGGLVAALVFSEVAAEFLFSIIHCISCVFMECRLLHIRS